MANNRTVWGFPPGYNPNLMGDRCNTCHRFGRWLERKLPIHPTRSDLGSAWSCANCSKLPNQPQDIPLD